MRRVPLLFLTVLVIATCGLVYELLAGAVASYVLGDSVTQFSLVIGLYLSAMGLGSYLSRFVDVKVARVFVEVELATALLGGASTPLLFLSFAMTDVFRVVLYGTVIVVGALVGLEIPLLLRILKDELEFKELVAKVLSLDYLGALAGSLLFAIVFVPELGLVRTSLLMGLLNGAVGLGSTWLLADRLGAAVLGLRIRAGLVCALMIVAVVFSGEITRFAEDDLYTDRIVFVRQTAYQRLVLTRGRTGTSLYIDGNLQFSSLDEYRYHEALVHPAMGAARERRNVLVLGGGDGLAVREVLKHPEVRRVVLVDLDPGMTWLARSLPPVRELNGDSLGDPRVRVVNEDAMVWLDGRYGRAAPRTGRETFDVVIADFPDPNNFSLGKLYTRRFYGLVRAAMSASGAFVVQSTSPLFARQAFWCIAETVQSAGFHVRPYHVAVPSFGEWGYVLARTEAFDVPRHLPSGLRYLEHEMLPSMFRFAADMERIPVEINRLDNQALVRYYEREWRRFQ